MSDLAELRKLLELFADAGAPLRALLDLAEPAAMLRDATCVGWEHRHGAGVPPLTLWLVRLPHIVASSVDDCNEVLDDVTAALKRLEEER